MPRPLAIILIILAGLAVMTIDALGVYWATEAYGLAILILAGWVTRNDWRA